MNTFQEWCKEILPIVQAGANGEEIEWSKKDYSVTWYNFKEADIDLISFDIQEQYRIKPKTTNIQPPKDNRA